MSGRAAERALARLTAQGRRSLPVRQGGRLLGSVTREELELALRHGLGHLALRDLALRRSRPGAARLAAGRALTRRQREILRQLALRAAAAGRRAYLVGGAVRDLLLGRAAADLDVAVDGDVEPIAEGLGGRVVRHDRFATASVALAGELRIDLSRIRAESYAHPGALPRVVPGDLADDLARRDFTVNALALPLQARGFGTLIDRHGGVVDLRQRRLRVMHGLSFLEDPTRAYRAVGLAVRLGLDIEPGIARLIRVALREGAFEALSASRLRREILLLFDRPGSARVVRWMDRLRLSDPLCPGARIPRSVLRPLERAEAIVDEAPGARRWLVMLGVVLAHLDRAAAESWIARLEPERRARAVLADAGAATRRVLSDVGDGRAARPSRIHRACSDRPREALLAAAACSARVVPRRRILDYLRRLRQVRADIDGRDLLRAGAAPGPGIARGLQAALEAKLDGEAQTPEEQLRRALRRAGRA